MKLAFAKVNKEGPPAFTLEDNLLTFRCTVPVIIQPSEIVKVSLGIFLKISKGWLLHISTPPDLYEKAGELFPASIIIDPSYTQELTLPIRNNGRNPLNLMVGDVIGRGYIVETVEVECQEGVYAGPLPSLPKTKPQKKDPFRFEVIK